VDIPSASNAGVDSDMPAPISIVANAGNVRCPIKTTVVAFASASAARLRLSGNAPRTSCPVIYCTRRAASRRVNGMPAAAAAAHAEGTPGIISNSIPIFF
jgi:hypothetical protein